MVHMNPPPIKRSMADVRYDYQLDYETKLNQLNYDINYQFTQQDLQNEKLQLRIVDSSVIEKEKEEDGRYYFSAPLAPRSSIILF